MTSNYNIAIVSSCTDEKSETSFFPRNQIETDSLSLLNVQDDTFVNRILSDATETFNAQLVTHMLPMLHDTAASGSSPQVNNTHNSSIRSN